jgi:uncharacterized protein YoxC
LAKGNRQVNRKKCLVIAPIGEEGSKTRIRSDQILTHVLRPVLTKFGFDAIRADEIAEPGIISTQILERIVNDPLVIADLSEKNPNVYYELAVRHATRKPIIQLIQKGELLPFDVAGTRTIAFDHKDLDSVDDVKKQLARFIENAENASLDGHDSPISLALDLQSLRESSDPQKASLADVVERMTKLQGTVYSIQDLVGSGLTHRLDQLLRIVADLKFRAGKNETASVVSELSESIEGLRKRVIRAVNRILDEVQEQHTELAKKIQSVFEQQSITATDTVERSFTDLLVEIIPENNNHDRLIQRLGEVFMHGMTTMGNYQQINITKQTEMSTFAIRKRITKSVEKVFHNIDEIEERITALPLPTVQQEIETY